MYKIQRRDPAVEVYAGLGVNRRRIGGRAWHRKWKRNKEEDTGEGYGRRFGEGTWMKCGGGTWRNRERHGGGGL